MSLSNKEKDESYMLSKDLGSFGFADSEFCCKKGSFWRIKEETIGDDGKRMLRFISVHDERARVRIYPEQVGDYFTKS